MVVVSINLAEKYIQNADKRHLISPKSDETFEKGHIFQFFINNLVFGGVIKPNLAQINTPNHVLIVTYDRYDHFMHWSKVKTFHFFINPL